MASELVAIAFEGESTAQGLLDTFKELEERGAIKLADAVIASRAPIGESVVVSGVGIVHAPGASGEVTVKQTKDKRGRRVLGYGSVGLILGTLIATPVGGLAIGALAGALRDKGIDNKFIAEISQHLKPDSSALILLVKEADAQAVLKELKPHKGIVLHTTLPAAMEEKLRDALREEQ